MPFPHQPLVPDVVLRLDVLPEALPQAPGGLVDPMGLA